MPCISDTWSWAVSSVATICASVLAFQIYKHCRSQEIIFLISKAHRDGIQWHRRENAMENLRPAERLKCEYCKTSSKSEKFTFRNCNCCQASPCYHHCRYCPCKPQLKKRCAQDRIKPKIKPEAQRNNPCPLFFIATDRAGLLSEMNNWASNIERQLSEIQSQIEAIKSSESTTSWCIFFCSVLAYLKFFDKRKFVQKNLRTS